MFRPTPHAAYIHTLYYSILLLTILFDQAAVINKWHHANRSQ